MKKVETVMEILDDIDGTPGAKTIRFGLDDEKYEIDLTPENEFKLREAIALYVGHARVRGTRSKSSSTSGSSAKPSDIRAWALRNGHTVADRGRISKEVIDAYEDANRAPMIEDVPAVLV